MSSNIQTVQGAYAAFGRGDVNGILETLDLNVVWKPPGAGHVWLPGYHRWDALARRHIWMPGRYRMGEPGHVWVPAHWQRTWRGWEFRQGHWR